ncbi:MAG: VacJ family lipoprotein [Rhodocyclaceae bacterium]|nr:VacJ family lipoprotein [Rhodocyclaceae bacterium]
MKRSIRFAAAATLAVALAGCASAPQQTAHPRDPIEGFNRGVHAFNKGLDKVVLTPVAKGYNVLPPVVRKSVGNFFANLGDVMIGINNLLQGKGAAGVSDFMRFAFNSTFGMLGFVDVATPAGLEKHNEDFGQTFGKWGVGSGAYVVLPFFGPSTVRDAVGLAGDLYTDPIRLASPEAARWQLGGGRVVSRRSEFLDVQDIVDAAGKDEYAVVRDFYLNRRDAQVSDSGVSLSNEE